MKRLLIFLVLACISSLAQMQATYVRSGWAQVPDPIFSPVSPYNGGTTNVTISDLVTSPAPIITYCIDTNNTCTPDTIYTGAINIATSSYIRAKAQLIGVADSNTVSWQGTITNGSPITHVASGTACTKAATGTNGAANTVVLSCTPGASGRTLIISAECSGTGTATATSIAISPNTGWTTPFALMPMSQASAGFYVRAYGTTFVGTPASTTFTITFTGLSNCTNFTSYTSDEFLSGDTTGGATTFYATANPAQTTGCSTTAANVTSTSANDAGWAMCWDSLGASQAGSGWSNGANDGAGDASIFKVGSGTLTPTWNTNSGTSITTSAVIKAQ